MQEQNGFQTSATTPEETKEPSTFTPTLNLRLWPDGGLTRKSDPVTEFNDATGQTVVALMKLMYTAGGVGLSACQAGINKRIIVYRVDDQEGYLINPEITGRSPEKQILQEGCLSFPGVLIGVERHKSVTVRYQDASGEWQVMNADGLMSQMVQHEIDHLDGIVFTRYLSQIKRDIVNRKMTKLKKALEKKRKLYERVQAAKGRDTGEYDFSIRGEQV